MNITLVLDQKTVEDIIYMIKSMPSQPSFLANIESQLLFQLAEPVTPEVPVIPEVPVTPEVPVVEIVTPK
jgi:hypothetical protein